LETWRSLCHIKIGLGVYCSKGVHLLYEILDNTGMWQPDYSFHMKSVDPMITPEREFDNYIKWQFGKTWTKWWWHLMGAHVPRTFHVLQNFHFGFFNLIEAAKMVLAPIVNISNLFIIVVYQWKDLLSLDKPYVHLK